MVQLGRYIQNGLRRYTDIPAPADVNGKNYPGVIAKINSAQVVGRGISRSLRYRGWGGWVGGGGGPKMAVFISGKAPISFTNGFPKFFDTPTDFATPVNRTLICTRLRSQCILGAISFILYV